MKKKLNLVDNLKKLHSVDDLKMLYHVEDLKKRHPLEHMNKLYPVEYTKKLYHVKSLKDQKERLEIFHMKGDRIQVLIRSDHTVKWKQLLKEDMTCVINNDIIGVVHEINNYQSKSDGKKIVGNVIIYHLWKYYGPKFLSYYHNDTKFGAIVIVVTHAIKDCQVSNGWSVSKLLINEDIPVIQEFLSNDFCKLKQDTTRVIVASTLKFVISKYKWFYYGCTKFSFKSPTPTHSYKCGCGEDVKQPIPRYKVEIYVRGGDAKYRFVFWDNGCANIIGKIAEEMCKSMLEDGEDDPMVYPDELGSLLNKKVAFRVKVQPNFSQTSIHKLDTNESFYTHIVNDYINCENQSKPQSPKVVPSEINPQLSSNHSMYACGENEHDFNSDVTLVKVNSLVSRDVDLDSDILGATQYSGTKLPKKVKIEPSN
ncbi:uncharacterized protein LOC127094185 [Lathyrus oleraceus]|uniref:uncharacterized protein LOC127094185 n=1 Tax=Pisum sativum TaxID=3888 RepID=UPI0021D20D95|nr:uncharacterized protein LOC127094185 [Pisum sativum]